MALDKMTNLPSKLIPFAADVASIKCKVCNEDHRYFCLKCDRLQPFCVKCKECNRPRHFLCTDTGCISAEAVGEPTGDFTCKYCRTVEKMTEFDDRPAPKCRQGSFTAVQLCLKNQMSQRQKIMLAQRQRPCRKCIQPMPLWRKCFYCGLQMEIACTPEECLPKTLDLRINPHWICDKCQVQHDVCPLDLENFCLSCKRDQPISIQCEECPAKFTMTCTFPYFCYNTVKLFYKQRLCKLCEDAAKNGFSLVNEEMCKMVEKEYELAEQKKRKDAEMKRKNDAAQAARDARRRAEEELLDRMRSRGG